jgi:tRNA modification GTPase
MAQTIYALSTAAGRAGIAIIRISGPDCGPALQAVTRQDLPAPRRASLRTFYDFDNEIIDEGLALYFPAPRSVTGEDVAELHVHGGRAVIGRLLECLARCKGLRLAGPGEFTRRAVENGKLDLTRAEAIADLVEAETEAQRRQALSQYEGGLFASSERWRSELTGILAWAEAAIDFAEDEVPPTAIARARYQAGVIAEEMQGLTEDGRRGEILRDGLHLTVIGPPNAGKSSFINALARRDVAIVSETAGTTRDVIEVRLDLGGYPVIVADTAGLRTSQEPIEREGVRRARERARAGDLTLLLLDGSSEEPLAGLDRELVADLTVWNKADLAWPVARAGLCLSLRTGQGLDMVIRELTKLVQERLGGGRREAAVLTRARHREVLLEALAALRRAEGAEGPDLFAEDLRLALRAIGRLTGRVDIEDVLDVIFRDFCIGK